jgi:hypothetical protein
MLKTATLSFRSRRLSVLCKVFVSLLAALTSIQSKQVSKMYTHLCIRAYTHVCTDTESVVVTFENSNSMGENEWVVAVLLSQWVVQPGSEPVQRPLASLPSSVVQHQPAARLLCLRSFVRVCICIVFPCAAHCSFMYAAGTVGNCPCMRRNVHRPITVRCMVRQSVCCFASWKPHPYIQYNMYIP